MFWSVPRDPPLQLFLLCPFLGRQVPPPAPILVQNSPPFAVPHIYPILRVPYSWTPSDTNTSLCRRVVWAPIVLAFWIVIFPIVLGLWIVIFWIVGPGIVIAASFTDPQSATLTLPTQVGKCGQCHYCEHYSQLNSSARIHNEYCTNITAIN